MIQNTKIQQKIKIIKTQELMIVDSIGLCEKL